MKITLILKSNVEILPPVLSLCQHLLDMGIELCIICNGMNENNLQNMQSRGCKVELITDASLPYAPKVLEKAYRWIVFRRRAWRLIENNPADYYWIASADTALALGKKLFSLPYVLHVHELYDQLPFYRKKLSRLMHEAARVFVSEEVRAHVFRAWYNLNETPVILPNKPHGHPRTRGIKISDPAAAAAFSQIPPNSRIVFHQGNFTPQRDLRPLMQAVEELGEPWVFAVQGKISRKGFYEVIKNKYKFYEIPVVPAPHHLEITSNVFCGVVTYTHSDMNCEFCAPNKIWEYSGFGLPIIGNDVLGLKNTVERFGAGCCMNFDKLSCEQIKEKLLELAENESEHSKNSTTLFESCDNVATLKSVLLELK